MSVCVRRRVEIERDVSRLPGRAEFGLRPPGVGAGRLTFKLVRKLTRCEHGFGVGRGPTA